MPTIEVSERSFEFLLLDRSTVMPVVVASVHHGAGRASRFFDDLLATWARA